MHHVDGRGVRAQEHDQALLEVRCPSCHRLTLRKKTRPTLEEGVQSADRRACEAATRLGSSSDVEKPDWAHVATGRTRTGYSAAMSQENVEIVRAGLAAWNAGTGDAMREF